MVCDVCCKCVEGEITTKATVYCTDCNKTMCVKCDSRHQHGVIEMNKAIDVDELLLKFTDKCDKHCDKYREIYCIDCKVPLCVLCCLMSHSAHTCSDIKEVAEVLSNEMSVKAEKLATKVYCNAYGLHIHAVITSSVSDVVITSCFVVKKSSHCWQFSITCRVMLPWLRVMLIYKSTYIQR